MQELREHETFEMEVLSLLGSTRVLPNLIFGGGTMLRLCHELPRYSVDLDFWFKPTTTSGKKESTHRLLKKVLGAQFELTDAKAKHFSYVYEIRSPAYRKRLKIEIRKESLSNAAYERAIAFSRFTAIQVQLDAFTLSQMAQNKIAAILDRHEIRDSFDLEWILRREPTALTNTDSRTLERVLSVIRSFKKRDFQVTLGSLLEKVERARYASQGFSWLEQTITGHLS